MDPQLKLWGTILGYMLLALTISACTSLWIRYHLKRNDLHQLILFKLGNICCESLLDYLILRMFIVFTLVVISYLLRRSPCNYLTLSRAILCDGEIYYDIVMCCVRGAHSSPCPLPLPANTVLLHVSRGDWQRTKHPAGDSNTNMDPHLVTTDREDGGS